MDEVIDFSVFLSFLSFFNEHLFFYSLSAVPPLEHLLSSLTQ